MYNAWISFLLFFQVKLHRVDENLDSDIIRVSLEDSKKFQLDCKNKNIMVK